MTRSAERRGFTLIEVMVYIAVLAIVMGGTVFFVINTVRNERVFSKNLTLVNDAEFAMRHIVDKTRGAKSIVKDNTAGYIKNFSKFANTDNPTCIKNCVLSLDRAEGVETLNTRFWVGGDGRMYFTEEQPFPAEAITRALTSSSVKVDSFIVKCFPEAGCGNVGGVKMVQIIMALSNSGNSSESETLITTIMPRGF